MSTDFGWKFKHEAECRKISFRLMKYDHKQKKLSLLKELQDQEKKKEDLFLKS